MNVRNLPRRVRNLNAIDIGLKYTVWADGSAGSRLDSTLPRSGNIVPQPFLPNQILDLTGIFSGPIPVGLRLGYFFFVQSGPIFPHAWLYYECTSCGVIPLP